MLKKIKYILFIVLFLTIISAFIYSKIVVSNQLKRQEVIEASNKLKNTYSDLETYLIKIDYFSQSYLKLYIPQRELICSNKNKSIDSFGLIADILLKKMHIVNYEIDFISNIIGSIIETDDYTQDLNSINDLKAETDLLNTPQPINHWKHVTENSEKYRGKDQWYINLSNAIDFDFKSCILSAHKLSLKYKFYNNMLKDDIKNHMIKIEEFYKKNNLDLMDLKMGVK